jgi:hypothetical protein
MAREIALTARMKPTVANLPALNNYSNWISAAADEKRILLLYRLSSTSRLLSFWFDFHFCFGSLFF